MNTFSHTLVLAALTLACAGASAQATTDEARAAASLRTAAQQREAMDLSPAPERAALGDYRAEAHQEQRLQQWRASQDALRSHRAGAHSQPLAVNSTDSARAEAHRQYAEQALDERTSHLGDTASAR